MKNAFPEKQLTIGRIFDVMRGPEEWGVRSSKKPSMLKMVLKYYPLDWLLSDQSADSSEYMVYNENEDTGTIKLEHQEQIYAFLGRPKEESMTYDLLFSALRKRISDGLRKEVYQKDDLFKLVQEEIQYLKSQDKKSEEQVNADPSEQKKPPEERVKDYLDELKDSEKDLLVSLGTRKACKTEKQAAECLSWLLLKALLQEKFDQTFDEELNLRQPDDAKLPANAEMRAGGRNAFAPITQEKYFIERAELAERIDQAINNSPRPVIFLSGDGGSGKSELARAAAVRYIEPRSADPRSVNWTVYSRDYAGKKLSKRFDAFLKENGMTEEDLGNVNKETLFIVDNLDYKDLSFFQNLLENTGDAAVLVTTRIPQLFEKQPKEIPELRMCTPCWIDLNTDTKRESVAEELFYRIRGLNWDTQSTNPAVKAVVSEICGALNWNLMFISYLLTSRSNLSPTEIRDALVRRGLLMLDGGTPAAFRHNDEVYDSSERLTSFVFEDLLQPDSFDSMEKQCLALLSFAPGHALNLNLVSELLGDDGHVGTSAAGALQRLHHRRVVTIHGSSVYLHPLMEEILRRSQSEPFKLCGDPDYLRCMLQNRLCTNLPTGPLDLAMLEQTYGKDDYLRIQLAFLMRNELRIDGLFRQCFPDVPAALLACVEDASESFFLYRDLSENPETAKWKPILHVRRSYFSEPTSQEPAALPKQGAQIRSLRLYIAETELQDQIPLWIPDTIGAVPITEIPDEFCCLGASRTEWSRFAALHKPLPTGLETIPIYAFRSLRLPNGLKRIGASAFASLVVRAGRETLELPEGLQEIDEEAFYACGFSGKLQLPASLVSIGDHAFACNCFSGDLCLPAGLKKLGTGCFQDSGFSGLLSIGGNLREIPAFAFADTGFTALNMSEGPNSIGERAFSECMFTDSICIPDTVEHIGAFAFFFLQQAKGTLTLPKNLKRIDEMAFSCCPLLKMPSDDEIQKLRDSDVKIGAGAFARTPEPYCERSGEWPPKLVSLSEPFLETRMLWWSSEMVDRMEKEPSGELVVPPDLVAIGPSTFYGKKQICGNLMLPESVREVSESAFEKSGLDGIVTILGETTICYRAFAYTKIRRVIVHDPDTVFERKVFLGCNKRMVIEAPPYSTAYFYAMENQIPFVELKPNQN